MNSRDGFALFRSGEQPTGGYSTSPTRCAAGVALVSPASVVTIKASTVPERRVPPGCSGRTVGAGRIQVFESVGAALAHFDLRIDAYLRAEKSLQPVAE
jgi:hypothetical protein